MSYKFQDYYKILGLQGHASEDDIKAAYRKLARKFHPDINKHPGAEEIFKNISEAYEVLKDPIKKSKYDNLRAGFASSSSSARGASSSNSSSSSRPESHQEQYSRSSSNKTSSKRSSGFSEFFESIFGAGVFGSKEFASNHGIFHGEDLETNIDILLEDAFAGAEKNITFDLVQANQSGQEFRTKRSYKVKIPKGIISGGVIRLIGEGGKGMGEGKDGDLLLRVRISPHDKFTLIKRDIHARLMISPSDAVLGSKIDMLYLSGKISVNVPPTSQSGTKLKLRSMGLSSKIESGDLYIELIVQIPKFLSKEEKLLYEKLREIESNRK